MQGGTLLANIERRGHLSEREAVVVVQQIAKALNFLHQKGNINFILCTIKYLHQKVNEILYFYAGIMLLKVNLCSCFLMFDQPVRIHWAYFHCFNIKCHNE